MSSNGRLSDSELAPIAQGRLAKGSYCAASWNSMNVEARKLGVQLLPTGSRSSYRPYADQEYFWNEYQAGRGNLAARPGTSNHGLGLAVDVATQAMRSMIDRIGQKYGWAKAWSDAPSEWWHLKYRAGVWSGSDPGPTGSGAVAPPAPAAPPTENMVASAVADNGNLHTFVATPDALFYAWQAKGAAAWSGGEAGKRLAGLSLFARAPSGRKIRAVAAGRAAGGSLHVFARYDDGSTGFAFQAKGSAAWSGGEAGMSVAGLSAFAPAP